MISAIYNSLSKRQLLHIMGVVLPVFFAMGVSYAAYRSGFTGMAMMMVGALAPVMIFLIFKFPRFGVLFYFVLAYWIMFILALGIDFPLGTVMDGLLLLLIIGFFIKQKKESNWEAFRNPISVVILIWIGYNIFQFANPTAESRLAWVYTVRTVAGVMLSYFIFVYHINNVKFIRLLLKIWLGMATLAAIYAIKQEYFGFFEFEQRALDSNPLLQSLLYIDGHWRKSSIFSDPVAFSYNMIVASIICISLIFGPTSKRTKIILTLLALLYLNVMLYSGTRAAYVLLPAAMALFAVLKFNRQIMVFSCIFGVFMLALINVPTSNPSINRFQSAFRPSDDASYNVRKQNQKRIQPYIQRHPFGGGLGATGVWGVRFAPYSFLAQFPPDSGYVRVAVELGWIGLILVCALFFVILKTGIDNYFKISDPELKTYCLAMVLAVFAMNIGNFPQEAIVQFPLNIYFSLMAALINVTLRLDRQKSNLVKDGKQQPEGQNDRHTRYRQIRRTV